MSTKLRSPFWWFGGKYYMRKTIIPILESAKHKKYIELFGGGGIILLSKKQAEVEVFNDLNYDVYNFFNVISDKNLFDDFYRQVCLLPLHRRYYEHFLATYQNELDPVKRAAKWWYVAKNSFSGRFGAGFPVVINDTSWGVSRNVSDLTSTINLLPEIHKRLVAVQFENQDWKKLFDKFDAPDALFYLDPPYVESKRKYGGYLHEFSDAQHEELVEAAIKSKSKIVISGYEHKIYNTLEYYGFRVLKKEVVSSAAGATRKSKFTGSNSRTKFAKRTEYLWYRV